MKTGTVDIEDLPQLALYWREQMKISAANMDQQAVLQRAAGELRRAREMERTAAARRITASWIKTGESREVRAALDYGEWAAQQL